MSEVSYMYMYGHWVKLLHGMTSLNTVVHNFIDSSVVIVHSGHVVQSCMLCVVCLVCIVWFVKFLGFFLFLLG